MAAPSFSQYDPYIDAAAKRFGVDPNLIRGVMALENYGGDAGLRGGSGEYGLMQVMPGTYADLARRHGLGSDASDPSNNIMAGTAYIAENLQANHGDVAKTLAAYNAGPGGSAKFRQTGDASTLPGVTQGYLQRAARFGLIDPTQAPPVNVASRTPVQTMTSSAGQSVNTANGVAAMPETATPAGLLSTGDAASANSSPWTGLLGNGMAQGQALMALAAGLMSGRDMGEGLTKGMQGFGAALQNAKAMQLAQLEFAKKAQQQGQIEALAKQYDGSNPRLAALIRSGNEAALNSIASNLVPKRGETPWYVSTDDNGKPQVNPQALNTYAATKQAENGLMMGPNGFQLPPGVSDATREKSMSESVGQQAGRAAYAGQIAGAEEAARAPYRVEQVGPGGTLVTPFPGGQPAQGQPAGGVVYQSPNPAPGTQQGRFEGDLGTKRAAIVDEAHKDAMAARQGLDVIQQQSDALAAGFQPGATAEVRGNAAALLQGFGVPENAAKRITGGDPAGLRIFQSANSQITQSIAKTLGANPTDNDAKLLQQSLAQATDPLSVVNAIKSYAERKFQGKIDRYAGIYQHSIVNGRDPLEYDLQWANRPRPAAPSAAPQSTTTQPVSPSGGGRTLRFDAQGNMIP
ncbi:hypothetical protein CRT60_09955 [Azospirillum palustre]|uniref:Transglycosylase SLT domain-containing protein n=1 Tax=Azospirillum palustre TaxID=2044885 RepID=A0A2B8BAA6_9PROT|nr:transglycosylase SLT domain-containing protein [Azospirillum palustre]PGH58244.1 hypothetical protein CRT60_09955 [Azospirillum palustre]